MARPSRLHSCHVISAAGNGGLGGTLGGSAGGRDGGGGSGSVERERQSIQRARLGGGGAAAAQAGGGGGIIGVSERRSAARTSLATPGMLPREHTYDRSGLIITAGELGDVRLLRSPSLVAAAPARQGFAHCDRVACARFLNEGVHAVSVGLRSARRPWEVRESESASVCCSGVASGALPGNAFPGSARGAAAPGSAGAGASGRPNY